MATEIFNWFRRSHILIFFLIKGPLSSSADKGHKMQLKALEEI